MTTQVSTIAVPAHKDKTNYGTQACLMAHFVMPPQAAFDFVYGEIEKLGEPLVCLRSHWKEFFGDSRAQTAPTMPGIGYFSPGKMEDQFAFYGRPELFTEENLQSIINHPRLLRLDAGTTPNGFPKSYQGRFAEELRWLGSNPSGLYFPISTTKPSDSQIRENILAAHEARLDECLKRFRSLDSFRELYVALGGNSADMPGEGIQLLAALPLRVKTR